MRSVRVSVLEVANTHQAHIEVTDSDEPGGALIKVFFPAVI